jgi:hypothetical protein
LVVGVKQAAPDNSFKLKPHNSFNRIADHRKLLSCGKRPASLSQPHDRAFYPAIGELLPVLVHISVGLAVEINLEDL